MKREPNHLTEDEKKIIAALKVGKTAKIADLAASALKNKPTTAKANSHVRNALRRLTRDGFFRKQARGLYLRTDPKKVAPLPAQEKAAKKPVVMRETTTDLMKDTPMKEEPDAPVKEFEPAKEFEPMKKQAKAKGAPSAAVPGASNGKNKETTRDYCETELQRLAADGEFHVGEDADFKLGLIMVAGREVGTSDGKIAKVTGLSRGYVIPRVKMITAKKLWPGKDLRPAEFATLFEAARAAL